MIASVGATHSAIAGIVTLSARARLAARVVVDDIVSIVGVGDVNSNVIVGVATVVVAAVVVDVIVVVVAADDVVVGARVGQVVAGVAGVGSGRHKHLRRR